MTARDLALGCSVACGVAVVLLLWVERRGLPAWRAPLKLSASSGFVAVALLLGATGSDYGRWILAALALGWLGDALLLSERSAWFVSGLVAFLLSHLCFGAAFVSGGVAPRAVAVSAVPALAAGIVIWRWLRPYPSGVLRVAVPVYGVVILAMCALAVGYAEAHQRWIALDGAVLFAVSDLAVARDRFVARSFDNKLWGWPTYFAAQLLLAWTVVYPNRG